MYFIKKNFMDFFTNSRDIFFVFVFLQILSAFSVFFVYGLLRNYQEERADMSLDTYVFNTSFIVEDKTRDVNNIRNVIDKIMEKSGDKIEGISILGFGEDFGVISYNGYEDGKITIPKYLGRDTQSKIFTHEDYISGEPIAVGTSNFEIGQKVTISGKEYEIIGIDAGIPGGTDIVYVPLNSMPDKIKSIVNLGVCFCKRPTESDYKYFVESLKDVYGEELLEIEEIYLDKASRKKEINSMNIVVILIGLVSSLNICIVYNSIIEKRRRKNAIIQICGCSYRSMCAYLFVEIVIITVVSYILGGGMFYISKKLWFNEAFAYFSMVFNVVTIAKLTLAYFATITISSIILSMVMNKKKPVDLLRRSYYV